MIVIVRHHLSQKPHAKRKDVHEVGKEAGVIDGHRSQFECALTVMFIDAVGDAINIFRAQEFRSS